jgi:hypothetical protein
LIFDLDPHDKEYSPDKITIMVKYFNESTSKTKGKLYINYPMIEAFYHMRSIPDHFFETYVATLTELTAGRYKERVNKENRNGDYQKFASNKMECSIVILQNIDKARRLIGTEAEGLALPEQSAILIAQLKQLHIHAQVAVLCTCPFFINEYNPELIRLDKL